MTEISPAHNQYLQLMARIRHRFEVIDNLDASETSDLTVLEAVAFQMRKIVEGIAFGCLVAHENGVKSVPKDARGQWNADNIFVRLAKLPVVVFPEPFVRQEAGAESPPGVAHHLVPQKHKSISIPEMRDLYRRLHVWLHEWNPYVASHIDSFDDRRLLLLSDLHSLREMIWTHMIGINGEIFLSIFDEDEVGQIRVVSASSNLSEVA